MPAIRATINSRASGDKDFTGLMHNGRR